MLQQTQVARVIPKYQAFLEQFPTLDRLKRASLASVLTSWQGLGYNRRAKYLWQLAQEVDALPKTQAALEQLPGIGPYTAAAVCAFAYNQPVLMLETNIRTVYLYHFFPDASKVNDKELLPLIEASLNQDQPREWYWALMDYGSYLKSVLPNPNRLSAHHTEQSTFTGSKRQVRGEILRVLSKRSLTKQELFATLTSNPEYFQVALEALIQEELVQQHGSLLSLAE